MNTLKRAFSVLLVLAMIFAPTGWAGTTNLDDLVLSGSLTLDGVEYDSLSLGSDGNWTSAAGVVTLDLAPTKFILTASSGNMSATAFTAGSGDITLENGQLIDGGTNNAIKFTDNSDTLSLTASGDDWVVDSTDGGVIFTLTDGTNGTVDFMTNNDADDYIQVSTTTNQPLINFVGCNGKITAASGSIDFDNENLTTSGALSSGATTVTSLIIGDETMSVPTDDTVRVASNDAQTIFQVYTAATGDEDAVLLLSADASADNGDDWQIVSDGTTNSMLFQNDATGSQATYLTLSNVGAITTTGDVVVAGTTPLVTVGDGGEEDAQINFNGNAQDFHIGLDDTADDLIIGLGTALGTTPIISMTDAGVTTVTGSTNGDLTVYGAGTSASDAYIRLVGDADADANDAWQLWNDSSEGSLFIGSDSAVAGTYVTKLTLAGATGNLTMAGDVLTLGDGEVISNAVDDTVLIQSNDASFITKLYSPNTSNGTVSLQLVGDAAADATDGWQIQNPANGTLTIGNDSAVSGTYVTKLTVAGADGDITTTGDIEIIDDMDLVFGTDSDWLVQYDEGVDNQLLFITAGTGCTATTDPMVEFLVGATPTADQQVFGIGKGTQASNTALFTVDEDGDAIVTGSTTMTGGMIIAPVSVTDGTTYAVLAANSGKVHMIPNLTADDVLTLPTAAAGLNYKFVYGGAAADVQDWTINTGADANFFIGGLVGHDPDDGDVLPIYANGSSNSKVKIDTPAAGTFVEVYCDGTHWILNGHVVSATDTHSAFSDQS